MSSIEFSLTIDFKKPTHAGVLQAAIGNLFESMDGNSYKNDAVLQQSIIDLEKIGMDATKMLVKHSSWYLMSMYILNGKFEMTITIGHRRGFGMFGDWVTSICQAGVVSLWGSALDDFDGSRVTLFSYGENIYQLWSIEGENHPMDDAVRQRYQDAYSREEIKVLCQEGAIRKVLPKKNNDADAFWGTFYL